MDPFNGKHNAAQLVDDAENRPLESQRLLDPAGTPDNLKEFLFGVGIPMPTRTCTRETAIALRHMAFPMFGNPLFYSPDSLEVGEARNDIVERGLRDGVEWMLFIDYDVSPPQNALLKLLSLNTDIAAGVYHLKQVPTYPLIFVKGWGRAYENYEKGDLIKADGAGMGCTLIKMDVFKNIEKPWFKTVPGYARSNSQILPHMTEDIYFCNKARAAGYDIIVDTSVQCVHTDWRSGIHYHLVDSSKDTRKPVPGWTYRVGDEYVTETIADVNHPGAKWADQDPPKDEPENPRLDLGCGDRPAEGHLGVDGFVDAPGVIKKDMRDLSWYREEYGLAPSIFSCHALEHLPYRDIMKTLREWMNTLAPGGELEVIVPDGGEFVKSLARRLDEGKDVHIESSWLQHGLFGQQNHDGDFHHALFTEKMLEQIAHSIGLKDISVQKQWVDGVEDVFPESAQLVLRGFNGKKPTESVDSPEEKETVEEVK